MTTMPFNVDPLTEEEKQQALQILEEAKELRITMRKRRKGKLVPSSTPLIRESREHELL